MSTNRGSRARAVLGASCAVLVFGLCSIAFAATITGTSGPDVLVGTNNADTISGKFGDDEIYPRGGNDQAYGGVGNDLIAEPDASTPLIGGGGNDSFVGNGGHDDISDAAGANQLQGNDGNDDLTDVDVGSGFSDVLKGGTGLDELVVREDALGPYDQHKPDLLQGGGGGDTLDAADGGGGDRMEGGFGFDDCTGEAADVFLSCEDRHIVP
jgi:Ca2+-binding RTX toxin-like protein